MSAYGSLASFYDGLMPAQVYEAWADCCEKLAKENGAKLLLDLACGTGKLTWLLSQRGYDTIGIDLSCDMLACAMMKGGEYPDVRQPLFLNQAMQELDLYGTVQGAVCSMDGMNYLQGGELEEALRRVRLFLEPGGFLLFDVHSPEKLYGMDGRTYSSESDSAYCVWNVTCSRRDGICIYDMDLFLRTGKLWRREREQHREYVHTQEQILRLASKAGFTSVEIFGGLPLRELDKMDERLFVLCRV